MNSAIQTQPATFDASSADPGRAWRRVVRSAVGLFCLLLLVDWEIEHVAPWSLYEIVANVARGDGGSIGFSYRHDISAYFTRTFACFVQPVFFMAPLLTVLASPAVTKPGWKRIPLLLTAVVLWLVALIPPYFYGARLLGSTVTDHDGAAIGMGLMSASLLLGFLAAVNAWRYRNGAQCVFWLGLYPVASVYFALGCLNIGSFSSGVPYIYLITPALGFVCGSLLFIAWIMWWRAVAQYEKVSSARVIQQQLETNSPLRRQSVAEPAADAVRQAPGRV